MGRVSPYEVGPFGMGVWHLVCVCEFGGLGGGGARSGEGKGLKDQVRVGKGKGLRGQLREG